MPKFVCRSMKTIGIAVLSFGAGIIMSFFLPTCVLVWIEAMLLVAAGVLYLGQR